MQESKAQDGFKSNVILWSYPEKLELPPPLNEAEAILPVYFVPQEIALWGWRCSGTAQIQRLPTPSPPLYLQKTYYL